MKTKLVSTLVAAPLLAMSVIAAAGEPLQLSETQMDAITAAGSATSEAEALALGRKIALTETATFAKVKSVGAYKLQVGVIHNVASTALSASASAAF
ncbi:MAG: hypothetical protein OEQ18_03820 [Gammaproteobacteria bacterium]|nr:hypothetical protein [Gammaproteobacteria bacterium]